MKITNARTMLSGRSGLWGLLGVLFVGTLAVFAVLAAAFFFFREREILPEVTERVEETPVEFPPGRFDTRERVEQIRRAVEPRVREMFFSAGAAWPPRNVVLIGIKDERLLEVWADDPLGDPVHVISYPVLAASGVAGPKLKEGDRQVPEGFYRIESLNPNSKFHLSLRVNYPNEADVVRAVEEGRDLAQLGGDIMIHGRAVSIGCLAIGDVPVEDLFFLAGEFGYRDWEVLLTPTDFRWRELSPPSGSPAWTGDLYGRLEKRLREFPSGG